MVKPASAIIWVINDDENVFDIMRRAFEMQGLSCQIKGFHRSYDLWHAFEHGPELPAILVFDYYLPVETGLELIEQLRANPKMNSIKTVLFSQGLTRDILLRAEVLNVFQINHKPDNLATWRQFAEDLYLAGYFS